jgi:hypothetical protein
MVDGGGFLWIMVCYVEDEEWVVGSEMNLDCLAQTVLFWGEALLS